MEKYLGDGIYAVFDGNGVQLRINSLEHPTDVVYLEPEVAKVLTDYLNKVFGDRLNGR